MTSGLGSNLAGLTLLYMVLPCVAAVVSRPAWRMLVLLIARYVSNLINGHYYYYYYCEHPEHGASILSTSILSITAVAQHIKTLALTYSKRGHLHGLTHYCH